MKYLSVCSGIESATVAWHPLGWEPVAFSEIEPFPAAVLAHHYPAVPNLGDMTKFKEWNHYDIDVLVGGTPCQSFSVAGLRKGLDDPRGNLMLTYLAIADQYRPRWLVWENVPGVLSSNGGKDFGTFLGGLGELGYGFAYRVLDAQYFGLAQRRRRVFVVGCLGDWRRAAAVLFERHSLSGHPAPSRNKGQGSSRWPAECASTLNAAFGKKLRLENQHINEGAPLFVPSIIGGWDYENNAHGPDDPTGPLLKGSPTGGGRPLPAIAFHENQRGELTTNDTAGSLKCNGGKPGQGYPAVQTGMLVRRLTPIECERLQGFRDDYTLIPVRGKPAADGPRYKALGNSMAVPVMAWIGRRIQAVEDLNTSTKQAA